MRHRKHNHQLGVKKEHRIALVANLAEALIKHGRIRTTLAKAKAVRPFVEKIITLAKKAAVVGDKAKSLHFHRLALSRLRNEDTVRILFNEKVEEFTKRVGGYTRIYKLLPRIGDAAQMATIELIPASDQGYKNSRRKTRAKVVDSKHTKKPKTEKASEAVALETEDSGEADQESKGQGESAQKVDMSS